ncbi:glycosyltransferase family 4 protein [Tessaracoccus caeni]|uniref:glycosyltransferase family 4 protein n=1 Tax=Tessaracoccus caeni TaxID=3031239 RepID=UPI0023DC3FD3|nr:glycosyltransferase family 4 protein [Tessaracoccus caeni]MDF1487564.1 glycosyltransferase family 4 protein [Tessaracoccus caeni]
MAIESVKALVGAGYRVIVTVPGPGPLIQMMTDIGATVVEQPTPIVRRGLLSPKGLLQLIGETVSSWGPMLRLITHTNAGTVLVNTVTPPLWFVVGRFARRSVVCHVHEAESKTSVLLRKALYVPLVLCQRVVVNSRFTLEVLAQAASAAAKKARIVHNAVPGPAEVVPPRPDLKGPVRIVYVGRLSHRKGPHVLVEAAGHLRDRGRDIALELVGAVFPGNEGYESELRDRVSALGLDEAVTFTGFQPTVWGALARSDIAVMPSVSDESFGNAAVEAALAARPLIAAEIPGIMEATEPITSRVVVPPGDSAALADAVERIVDDWADYAARAVSDSKTVARTYSQERYAEGLIAALGLAELAQRSSGTQRS